MGSQIAAERMGQETPLLMQTVTNDDQDVEGTAVHKTTRSRHMLGKMKVVCEKFRAFRHKKPLPSSGVGVSLSERPAKDAEFSAYRRAGAPGAPSRGPSCRNPWA